MGVIHTEKLAGPSVWKGPDFKDNNSWIRPLTPAHAHSPAADPLRLQL